MKEQLIPLAVNTYEIQGKKFRSVESENMFWISIYDLGINFSNKIRRACKNEKQKSFYVYTNGNEKCMSFVPISKIDKIADSFELSPYKPSNDIVRAAIKNIGRHILSNKPDAIEVKPEVITNPKETIRTVEPSHEHEASHRAIEPSIDLSGFVFAKKRSRGRAPIKPNTIKLSLNKQHGSVALSITIDSDLYKSFGMHDRVSVGFNSGEHKLVIISDKFGYKLTPTTSKKPLRKYFRVLKPPFDVSKYKFPCDINPDQVQDGWIVLKLKPLSQ